MTDPTGALIVAGLLLVLFVCTQEWGINRAYKDYRRKQRKQQLLTLVEKLKQRGRVR